MASSAKTFSHQALNGRAAIAVWASQREKGPQPPPSQMRSQYTRFPPFMGQGMGKRKRDCSYSGRNQGSKAQRSDGKKHRSTPIEEFIHPVPNGQASWQDRDQDHFLSTQRSLQSADEWFQKLEAMTLPLFRKERKDTRDMTGYHSKAVRIAILDVGIESQCSFRSHIKAGRSFIKEEKRGDYWQDETGHGTALAYQIARVCPNAEIYIARIARRANASGKIIPDRQAIVQALKVASEEWKVDIINKSFGWELQDDDDGVEDALNAVGSLGCILIFASSTNDGALNDILFPARHRDVIAVDAVDGLGKSFSNTGSTESGRKQERFSAPGLNVASLGGRRVTGSSFASPVVAGIAGLVIETFRHEIPEPEASVYRRLGTRGAMEIVLKLLSKKVEGFNFLQPWIELQEDSFFSRCYFCQRIIKGALKPTFKGIGASYLLRIEADLRRAQLLRR